MGRRNRRRIDRAHDGLGRRPVSGQLGFRRGGWLHQPIKIEERQEFGGLKTEQVKRLARVFPAAVFWQSGQTKVAGWHRCVELRMIPT